MGEKRSDYKPKIETSISIIELNTWGVLNHLPLGDKSKWPEKKVDYQDKIDTSFFGH